jgi:hypothetical protein
LEQFGKRRNKEEERKNGKNERKDLTLTGLLMEGPSYSAKTGVKNALKQSPS